VEELYTPLIVLGHSSPLTALLYNVYKIIHAGIFYAYSSSVMQYTVDHAGTLYESDGLNLLCTRYFMPGHSMPIAGLSYSIEQCFSTGVPRNLGVPPVAAKGSAGALFTGGSKGANPAMAPLSRF